MSCYALYRLPGESHYMEIRQSDDLPDILGSYEEVGTKSGFVVAPFVPSSDSPILMIRPDHVARHDMPMHPKDGDMPTGNVVSRESCREVYANDFRLFHSHIVSGEFQKLVLARQSVDSVECQEPPLQLFGRACRLYPKMFVALVVAPQCGMWLTATPETLLEGSGGEYHTIALAGTMGLWGNTPWSEKNRHEQQYVASYIAGSIRRFTDDYSQSGPYTVAAGDICHLRTDFTFRLTDRRRLGEFVAALHPTPAVCGLPKHEAMQFIVNHETMPRRYYSGFMGPVDIIPDSLHLFVSLRCMSVSDGEYRQYAGGGLLADSEEGMEWNETESKMQTIRRCYTRKIK